MENFLVKCGIFCLLFYAAKSVKEPLSVTRGVLDRFRVDEFSCVDDERVCTRRNAICQTEGSCLCRNNTPDYVNPELNVNYGYLSHGTFDGCMSVAPVVDSIDPYNLACSYSFRPYQLVPSTRQGEPIMFIHSAGTHYHTCNFTNALGKYPGRKSWVPLEWLNDSYLDINMTYVGVLLFGWRLPVPELGGLMVVMNLHCSRIELNHKYVNNTIANQCLRVKVKGTTFSIGTRISRSNIEFSILVFIGYLLSYINT